MKVNVAQPDKRKAVFSPSLERQLQEGKHLLCCSARRLNQLKQLAKRYLVYLVGVIIFVNMVIPLWIR